MLLLQGKNDEAYDAFLAVVESDDSERFAAHAWGHLGALALGRRHYEDTVGFYRKSAAATEDATLQAEARYQIAVALMGAQEYEEAVTAWDQYLGDHGDHDRVAAGAAQRAISIARLGLHTDALAAINAARRGGESLSPSLRTSLWYEQAWCHRGLDDADAAADAYGSLLEQSSDSDLAQHARLELAELAMNAERYGDAADLLGELRPVLEARGESLPAAMLEQTIYRQGVCAFRTDDFETAAATLETFLDEYDESSSRSSALLLAGEAHFQSGDFDSALNRLEQAIESVDEDADHEVLGPALLRLGETQGVLQRWEDSEKTFADYLKRFEDEPTWYQARFGIAWAKENSDRRTDAIEDYRAVVDKHEGPTAARAQFQIGECLFAMKQHQDAVRELLKVDILYDYPEWNAAALYEAARCFEALSNPVAARQHFQQVIAEHPDTEWASLAAQRLEALRKTNLPGRG